MNKRELEIFQEFERALPPTWFAKMRQRDGAMYPFVRGVVAGLAELWNSLEAVQQQVIPRRSEGFWLSLHLLGIGLGRYPGESDARAYDRYRFEFQQTRNTRAGLLRYIHAVSGLPEGAVRVEADFEAGRFGSLRLVLDAAGTPYQAINWDWPSHVLLERLANGLVPAVDINLRNLSADPLPPWRFDSPFPVGPGQLGPIYDRPGFVDELRLIELSRNHFAWLTPAEWSLKPLGQIFRDAHVGGQPGAQFAYLVDAPLSPDLSGTGRFLEIDWQPPRIRAGEVQLGRRAFGVDGFKFHDLFPRQGNQSITETVVIDIQVLGTDPASGSRFGGRATGFPVFAEPGVFAIAPAESFRLGGRATSLGIHQRIPKKWLQPGDRFGRLRPFSYNARSEFREETITRQIPDWVSVEWQRQGPETVNLLKTWWMRGNWWQNTQFLEGSHQFSGVETWELPLAFDDPSGHLITGRSGSPKVAQFISLRPTTRFDDATGHGLPSADAWAEPGNYEPLRNFEFTEVAEQRPNRYYAFGNYSFPSRAEPATEYPSRQPGAMESGAIPNVREPFSRRQIIQWFEVIANLEAPQTPDSLKLMGNGPWELRLGAGNPGWGDLPPAGISPLQNEFARLDPSSIWWTDVAGVGKFSKPSITPDGLAFLAIEFLLPKGGDRQLREIELRIGYPQPEVGVVEGAWELPDPAQFTTEPAWEIEDVAFDVAIATNTQLPVLEIVHYRRVSLAVSADTNFGIVFRVATRLRDPIVTSLPAFRTGQSRVGDELRTQDFAYVI